MADLQSLMALTRPVAQTAQQSRANREIQQRYAMLLPLVAKYNENPGASYWTADNMYRYRQLQAAIMNVASQLGYLPNELKIKAYSSLPRKVGLAALSGIDTLTLGLPFKTTADEDIGIIPLMPNWGTPRTTGDRAARTAGSLAGMLYGTKLASSALTPFLRGRNILGAEETMLQGAGRFAGKGVRTVKKFGGPKDFTKAAYNRGKTGTKNILASFKRGLNGEGPIVAEAETDLANGTSAIGQATENASGVGRSVDYAEGVVRNSNPEHVSLEDIKQLLANPESVNSNPENVKMVAELFTALKEKGIELSKTSLSRLLQGDETLWNYYIEQI